MDGGYDSGYKSCPCFWGTEPGSLVKKLPTAIGTLQGLRVLDVGCGEGKNAAFLAGHGAEVIGIDVSEIAIEHARVTWPGLKSVEWRVGDARNQGFRDGEFDVVIAYGLLHCLGSEEEAEAVIRAMQRWTRPGGHNVVVALNARIQELDAQPELHPCWLPHAWYEATYAGWQLMECFDSDLHEVHPHNNIPHMHSVTRILAQKK